MAPSTLLIKQISPLLLILALVLQQNILTCAEPTQSHSASHRRWTSKKQHKYYPKPKPESRDVGKLNGLFGIDPNSMKVNDVHVGFIMEGKVSSIDQINQELGMQAATFGKYAQVDAYETFTGRWQLGAVFEEVKASGAVFQASIMAPKTDAGFTWGDNHQAVAVAHALKKFTDANIPVHVRFNHEHNWYYMDGTYKGDKNTYKKAWAVFADAMRKICPKAKLLWTPNVASMKVYAEWEPDNFDRDVDMVGIDWYPKTREESTTEHFLKVMKDFHDRYASPSRPFVLAEAGLHYGATHQERVDWLDKLTKAKTGLPYFLSLTWYNCDKEWDYKLVGGGLNVDTLKQKLT